MTSRTGGHRWLLALLLVLAGELPAPAATALDIIGKWEVVAIQEPDPANPHLSTVQHPERGAMSLTIDHATITSSVTPDGGAAQVDKERYAVIEESPGYVLIRVAAHKPYNIAISRQGHDLRWSSADFDITLSPYDAAAIAAAKAAEQAAAARSAVLPAGPIRDQPLHGLIDGQPWSAVACVRSAVQAHPGMVRCAILCEAPDAAGGSHLAQLLLEIPTAVGHLDLGPGTSITFCIPPGRNLVANDGELSVTAASAQAVSFSLSARFDAGNQVNGRMTLDLTQALVQTQDPLQPPAPPAR